MYFFKDINYYKLKVLKGTDPGGTGYANFFLDETRLYANFLLPPCIYKWDF